VNPAIFFPIAGVVLIAWGCLVAIKNRWAAGWMSKMQSIYGKRAAAMVTPGYVRAIGILLAIGGVLFIVLAVLGVFPNRYEPF
jgi:hypothetical protein